MNGARTIQVLVKDDYHPDRRTLQFDMEYGPIVVHVEMPAELCGEKEFMDDVILRACQFMRDLDALRPVEIKRLP